MIDNRENFKNLLRDWHLDWAKSGRPIEATAPTLKTYIANEIPYSNRALFNGRLPNIQPIFEERFGKKKPEPEVERQQGVLTTLEKACGLEDTSNSQILMARVASFSSEQTRDEANCAALSFYLLGLTPHDNKISLFDRKEANIPNFQRVRKLVLSIMDADAEYFLTRFFSCSVRNFHIRSGGNAEPIIGCMYFWYDYASWRTETDF